MKEFLLPPRRRVLSIQLQPQELRRFAEARAWRNRRPQPCVMRTELPGGSATHAEATDDDAVFVNAVLLFHFVQRLEQIHFACELVGVAITTVQMQHDGIARREFAVSRLAVGQEIDLAQRLATPVEPSVQSPAMRGVRSERR